MLIASSLWQQRLGDWLRGDVGTIAERAPEAAQAAPARGDGPEPAPAPDQNAA
jgi:hypothetical protein